MVLFLIKGNFKDSDKVILRTFREYEKLLNNTKIDTPILPYEKINVNRDNPKPVLEFDNKNKVYFSLSHTDGYTLVGFSNEEIGVDIEKHKNRDIQNLKNRVCKNKELSKIKEQRDFFDIWTKKEAYIKYFGKLTKNSLKDINTFNLDVKTINLNILQNYSIAVCNNFNDMLIRVLTLC